MRGTSSTYKRYKTIARRSGNFRKRRRIDPNPYEEINHFPNENGLHVWEGPNDIPYDYDRGYHGFEGRVLGQIALPNTHPRAVCGPDNPIIIPDDSEPEPIAVLPNVKVENPAEGVGKSKTATVGVQVDSDDNSVFKFTAGVARVESPTLAPETVVELTVDAGEEGTSEKV